MRVFFAFCWNRNLLLRFSPTKTYSVFQTGDSFLYRLDTLEDFLCEKKERLLVDNYNFIISIRV